MSTIQTESLPLSPLSELTLAAQIADLRMQTAYIGLEMIIQHEIMKNIVRSFSSIVAPIQINPLIGPASLPILELSSISAASGSLSTKHPSSFIDLTPFFDLETSSTPASLSSALKLCSVCEARFANKNTLKRHMRRRHKNFRPYQCGYCTKDFTEKYVLKRHLLVHTDKRPYKCTEAACNRAYKERGSLKQHIQTVHKGIKDRQCSICNKFFAKFSTLRVHIQNVHLR